MRGAGFCVGLWASSRVASACEYYITTLLPSHLHMTGRPWPILGKLVYRPILVASTCMAFCDSQMLLTLRPLWLVGVLDSILTSICIYIYKYPYYTRISDLPMTSIISFWHWAAESPPRWVAVLSQLATYRTFSLSINGEGSCDYIRRIYKAW